MLALDQMKSELTAQRDTLTEVVSGLEVESKKKRIEEIGRAHV